MSGWREAKNDLTEILSASWRGFMSVIRTQLILAGITFIVLCIGFAVLKIPLWGLIAFLVALVDIIPMIGSGMVMIPWAAIVLISGNTRLAVGLLVVYAVIFVTRQILDPVINGKRIGVKPIFTLLSTILLTLLLGPWGLFLGSVAAIAVKTALDIRERRRSARSGAGVEPDDAVGPDAGPR
jgi:predicted PurR-regulated permease PerM